MADLVFGYENPKVVASNAKAQAVDYKDYYWKSGDAILYNPIVTPFI